MRRQLRVYRIEPGQARRFADEWARSVRPLREAFGFRVAAAWVSDEEDLFTWLLEHNGDFEGADAAYYRSPERAAFDVDPRRLIADVIVTAFVEPIES